MSSFEQPLWRDSHSGWKSFFATPAGRLCRAPFVVAAFAFLWVVEIVFLWLAVENFNSPAVTFAFFAGLLFFWSVGAVWTSFFLLAQLWRAPLPVIAVFPGHFEVAGSEGVRELSFSSVDAVTVVGDGGERFSAVFSAHETEPVVADLLDRDGFVKACRAIPALRLKVRQKLGS